jgi:hypothetical protein
MVAGWSRCPEDAVCVIVADHRGKWSGVKGGRDTLIACRLNAPG